MRPDLGKIVEGLTEKTDPPYRCRWCKDTGMVMLATTSKPCLDCPPPATPTWEEISKEPADGSLGGNLYWQQFKAKYMNNPKQKQTGKCWYCTSSVPTKEYMVASLNLPKSLCSGCTVFLCNNGVVLTPI